MAREVGIKLGPYELTGLIGAGGMGEVYRAHDPRLNRDVAVKVLPSSPPKSEVRSADHAVGNDDRGPEIAKITERPPPIAGNARGRRGTCAGGIASSYRNPRRTLNSRTICSRVACGDDSGVEAVGIPASALPVEPLMRLK